MGRVKFAEGTKMGVKKSRTLSKAGRNGKSKINRYFENSTKSPPDLTKRSEKVGPKTVSPGSMFVEKRKVGNSRRGGHGKEAVSTLTTKKRRNKPEIPRNFASVLISGRTPRWKGKILGDFREDSREGPRNRTHKARPSGF